VRSVNFGLTYSMVPDDDDAGRALLDGERQRSEPVLVPPPFGDVPAPDGRPDDRAIGVRDGPELVLRVGGFRLRHRGELHAELLAAECAREAAAPPLDEVRREALVDHRIAPPDIVARVRAW
jgi:hypothetical protein